MDVEEPVKKEPLFETQMQRILYTVKILGSLN